MKINPLTYLAETKLVNKFIDRALKEKTVTRNNIVKKVTNYSELQKTYPKIFMLWLGILQCYFLNKSKEIPDERKIPLIFNNIYTCSIGLLGGLLTQRPIDKLTEKLVQRAYIVYEGKANKAAMINGIKTGVPFTAAGFLFHYVGAVLATPLATQTTDFLHKKGLIHYNKN